MIWALIFDVDGVVADTEALNARASVLMFQQLYGVTVQPEDFQPFIGTGDERYVEGVAEKYDVQIDTQAARQDPEVKIAIATSGQKAKQFPVIEGTGLKLEWFDAVITGDDVDRKKPDPQIYLRTAERLGLAPKCCIVFEDAPAGVQAAKAAGMACVAVTTSAPAEELQAADVVVESLAKIDLPKLRSLIT